MAKFFGDWESFEDMARDFNREGYSDTPPPPVTATEEEVLWATYTYEDYSGIAHVIFGKNGELFEVYGSHCSCNGLGGQWEPALVTWKSLALRLDTLNTKDEEISYDSDGYRSPFYHQPLAARKAFYELVSSRNSHELV